MAVSVKFYDKKGLEIEKPELEKDMYKILAKSMQGTEVKSFWISYTDGGLTDVKKLSESELKKSNSKLHSVSEAMFNQYIKYLQSDSNRISLRSIKG